MELLKQVCTLLQGNRLKGSGVHSPSVFSHFKADNHSGVCITDIFQRHVNIMCGCYYSPEDIALTPAFTVAELSIMLGNISNGCEHDEEFNLWFAHWDNNFIERFDTQAQCLSAMLINYLQTGEITAVECNERLTL